MSSCTSWSFLAWLACALSRLSACVVTDCFDKFNSVSTWASLLRKPLEIAFSSASFAAVFFHSCAITVHLSSPLPSPLPSFLSSASSFAAAANCSSNFLERACSSSSCRAPFCFSSSSFSRNCCSACAMVFSRCAYSPPKGWVCRLRAGAPSSCTATGVCEIGVPGAWSDASDARFLAAVSC
ncbi:hypothetical protein PF006_g29450 [Phytophthora fragariae]|uniref:Secreted protein n=1 Tax=Phytophthora fragariae TaxID=53985 RepID=A0A6A3Q752_9STRA|nr:hypothetical protein PF006_g29450 [Phytophthora fragariae]